MEDPDISPDHRHFLAGVLCELRGHSDIFGSTECTCIFCLALGKIIRPTVRALFTL